MKTATYHAVTPEQANWWLEAGHQEQSLGKAMVLRIPCKSLHDPLPCPFSGLIPTLCALAPFNSSLIDLQAAPLHPPDRPHLRVPTLIPSAPSLSRLLLYFLKAFPSHLFSDLTALPPFKIATMLPDLGFPTPSTHLFPTIIICWRKWIKDKKC